MKVVIDTEISNTLKYKIIRGKPIPFGSDFIIQHSIDYIMDEIGEEVFQQYIWVFATTEDVLGLPDDFREGFTVFDMFFIIDQIRKTQNVYSDENSLVQLLKKALCFFFKTDNVILYEDENIVKTHFVINFSTIVDRNNFDELSNLILLICKKGKLINEEKEQEKLLEGKSEDFIRRYKNHLRNRKKYQEKHKSDNGIWKIVNTIVHYQDKIDYNVGDFTFWQLLNTYENLINKEAYQRNVDLLSVVSSEDAKKLDTKHWSEKMKIELEENK